MNDLKLPDALDFLAGAGMTVIVLDEPREGAGEIKDFYVSLIRDLLGVYLRFRADSAAAVRCYLDAEYCRNGVWGLPWCSVYETIPVVPSMPEPIIVLARNAPILYLADYQERNDG
jgi:hypothetical protein